MSRASIVVSSVVIVIVASPVVARADGASSEMQAAIMGGASIGPEQPGAIGPGVRLAYTGGGQIAGGLRFGASTYSYDLPTPQGSLAPDAVVNHRAFQVHGIFKVRQGPLSIAFGLGFDLHHETTDYDDRMSSDGRTWVDEHEWGGNGGFLFCGSMEASYRLTRVGRGSLELVAAASMSPLFDPFSLSGEYTAGPPLYLYALGIGYTTAP
jgi:hypothetical protein